MNDEKGLISIICYNEQEFFEKKISSISEAKEYCKEGDVVWINIDGISLQTLEELRSEFSLHPLTTEYIKNKRLRPTIKDFEDYVYLLVKMLHLDIKDLKIMIEQVSLIIKGNVVISVQEKVGDVFNDIRDRIREGRGNIRKMGSDYLLYSLLDAIVNTNFHILEKLGERVVVLEDAIVLNPNEKIFREVHRTKIDLIYIRKSVWPLREVVNYMLREDMPMISKKIRPYLYDLYEKVIQIIDSVETYREMISGMLDIYLTSISNKTNEIMKILTIIATIFIPLTFITGIYGMNFRYMPEIYWRWGYVFALTLMLIVAIGMLLYFKNKKWI